MALDARGQLRKDVIPAEGTGPIKNGRLMPYLDCCGKYWRDCTCQDRGRLTIGHGRNIDDNGISKLEAEVLCDHDLADAEAVCFKTFDWFSGLTDGRQRCVVEMVFNLGLGTFLQFQKLIAAIILHDWAKAAAEILNSKAAKDAPLRFGRLAMTMRNG